ncbi:hypothetical protein [Microlunatus sp. Gsoil 973]|uniref:hypothetical protein n=1 Tax=Microlunatus sp. Gsoil 973 TaxID=2672569 RepID=UPI0012B48160|nr:hypothetical protein [Microlunatus sp. Gsoil 973]QGN32837.1 hypothetical protein GJV80_08475 [Microlunatus sp. Gsoil 973]
MSKKLVVAIFVWSLLGMIASVALIIAAIAVAVLSDSLIMQGDDVVGIERSPSLVAAVVMASVGVLVLILASIGQFVAWVGAVVNTFALEDKAWFVILLVAGLVSLGFVATLIYVIIGPDGSKVTAPRQGRPVTTGA